MSPPNMAAPAQGQCGRSPHSCSCRKPPPGNKSKGPHERVFPELSAHLPTRGGRGGKGPAQQTPGLWGPRGPAAVLRDEGPHLPQETPSSTREARSGRRPPPGLVLLRPGPVSITRWARTQFWEWKPLSLSCRVVMELAQQRISRWPGRPAGWCLQHSGHSRSWAAAPRRGTVCLPTSGCTDQRFWLGDMPSWGSVLSPINGANRTHAHGVMPTLALLKSPVFRGTWEKFRAGPVTRPLKTRGRGFQAGGCAVLGPA